MTTPIKTPVENIPATKKSQSVPAIGYGKKSVIMTPASQTPPRKA